MPPRHRRRTEAPQRPRLDTLHTSSMTLHTSVATLSLLIGAAAQGTSKDYPPGWNGEATTPPMGWRSWNAFGANIRNETFVQAISALTAKVWSVDGKMVSLADVGYSRVGIDEGWENCSGTAPDDGMRQHDALGFPMVPFPYN